MGAGPLGLQPGAPRRRGQRAREADCGGRGERAGEKGQRTGSCQRTGDAACNGRGSEASTRREEERRLEQEAASCSLSLSSPSRLAATGTLLASCRFRASSSRISLSRQGLSVSCLASSPLPDAPRLHAPPHCGTVGPFLHPLAGVAATEEEVDQERTPNDFEQTPP